MSRRVSYRRYGNGLGCGPVEIPVFLNLSEVEKVLSELENEIKRNGHATVADFYKLTGGRIMNEDTKYGWKHLLDCTVINGRYGYELQMTAPTCLKENHVQDAYDVLCGAGEDEYDIAVSEAINILSKAL